jgi:hypothetical protein
VRRLLSITLLLLFVLPSFAASLLQNTDSNVPVCCRAKGKHHCMMMVPETVSRGGVSISVVREKCPAFPKSTAWASSQLTVPQSQSGIAAIVTSPNAILQAEAHYRIAWSRSRQKRGPPSLLS